MKETSWELSQEFLFEANAEDVVTYILGSDEWLKDGIHSREIEITDGQFVMRLWLSASPAPRALYTIGIVGGTRVGTDFYSEEAYMRSLLSPTSDLGEIALRQSKVGECLASFYLENNPRRLGSEHTSLWGVTLRLLGVFWNDLIHDWINQSEVASSEDPNLTRIASEIATPGAYTQAIGRYITDLDLITVSNTEGSRTTIRADSATRGPIAEYTIELRDDGFTSFTHKPLGDLDLYRQLTDRIIAHIGEVLVTAIRWDESSQAMVNRTSIDEGAPELSYIEQKIKVAFDEIVMKGELHPTDETIAARLPIGPKGQPYSRETVNRYRNKMRRRGIDV